MRIAFFGATKVGYNCCKQLIEMGQDIVGIFTMPREFFISYSKEKPIDNILYEDFHKLAKEYRIPIVEIIKKMSSHEYIETLKRWMPDFILVIGWYYLVPKVIRDMAPLGCAGIHASLLPRYAGGAPLVWAIIRGEQESGASLFYFDDGVDTGDIIAQEKIEIGLNDTIKTVYSKAEDAMLKLLKENIPKIENGIAPRIKQDLTHRTVFPQRKPEDGLIDWGSPSLDIYNFIRAQTSPYPGAFTFAKGQMLTIWEAKLYDFTESIGEPGQVLGIVDNQLEQGILVSTANSDIPLLVTQVGIAEISSMKAIDYAKRKNLRGGEILGKS
jgi:methionyl-tRNA formyltransferase